MRIGVTGSSGFVGSHLLQAIEGSEPYCKDVAYDVVIHLAGENIASSRWSEEKKRKILNSRIETTRALTPPKVLICASAITQRGSFLEHVQIEWEKAAHAVGAERVVCTRFGIVIHPKGGILKRLIPLFKLGLGGNLGNGRQSFVWIALNDVIGGIKHCIANEISGPIDFCSSEIITNGEFTKILASHLHRPAFCHLPEWILTLIFGEMGREVFLSNPECQSRTLVDTGYPLLMPRLEAALKG